jgi:hypothetical protein
MREIIEIEYKKDLAFFIKEIVSPSHKGKSDTNDLGGSGVGRDKADTGQPWESDH